MMPRNPEDIKVVAVAESQQQRLALSDTIKSIGLDLVECVSSQALVSQKIPNDIDLWLVDSQYDEGLSRLIGQHASDAMLVGFSEAPYLNETQMYHRWQRKLKKGLPRYLICQTSMIPNAIKSRTIIGIMWWCLVLLWVGLWQLRHFWIIYPLICPFVSCWLITLVQRWYKHCLGY